jgi:hypothetical protein
VWGEQLSDSRGVVRGQLSYEKLKKMQVFSSNRPFFVLERASEGAGLVPVYRGEVGKGPAGTWKPFEVPLAALKGDQEAPLSVSVWHARSSGPQLIGRAETTLTGLLEASGALRLRDGRAETGAVRPRNLQVVQRPTFLDYLRGGVQVGLVTALDFTASNGDPRMPTSLHFGGNGPSPYEVCIREVGGVVCPYDSDQLFPVYGFGAQVAGQVQHCFPCTFLADPNVRGLDGIIGCYRHALTQIRLSGPTLFAPILTAATQLARASWAESRSYTILLIITDGVINDMEASLRALDAGSQTALSVIIVGVGNADFSAMVALDGDDRVRPPGVRDICQFVPFNRFAANPRCGLAEEVLAELPTQLAEFCESVGFRPAVMPQAGAPAPVPPPGAVGYMG